jgi:hypothetical protein
MKIVRITPLVLAVLLSIVPASWSDGRCGFTVEEIRRITFADGKSQTARNNARCICVDPMGTVHMVWEDSRSGNFEIYYTSLTGDSTSPALRISDSRGESVAPCIACDSSNVYMLWQEHLGTNYEIFYLRMAEGKEIARRRITRNALDSGAPVAAVGSDGALNIAWHEGPYDRTRVLYGRIVGDSLVLRTPIADKHPGAFRPDIVCKPDGTMLVVWFEQQDIKSRAWNGKTWGEEQLVVRNNSKPYRLSLTDIGGEKWALVWFDRTAEASYDVLAKFCDGNRWYGQVEIDTGNRAYYPSITGLGDGKAIAVWEEQDKASREFLLLLRCYDGTAWTEPTELIRDTALSRYCSLASAGGRVHAIWFSPRPGNNEIYYGLLRTE